MMKKLLLAACAATLAVPAPAATLTTPIAGGNGQDGIMFDIQAGANALTIQSLGVNIGSGTGSFEFYIVAGGITGNLDNSAAWTLVNSFTDVTTNGLGNLTFFDITDFNLAAGNTYGLYFTNTTETPNVGYTDGLDVGDVVATDGNLTIFSGYGKNYPFDQNFLAREFNGSITYAISTGAVPEPATWAMMIAGFGIIGAGMRKRVSKVTFAGA